MDEVTCALFPNEVAPVGAFVKVRSRLLEPGHRKAGVPDDTAATPYEMRVAGRLHAESALGDEAIVTTVTGRQVAGVLEENEPAYLHTFGPIDPALREVRSRVRDWMAR